MVRVGLVIICINFGISSLAQGVTRLNYSGNREVVDKNGNIVEYEYLDGQGRPHIGRRLAKKTFDYDSLNRLVRETYFRGDGTLFQHSNGVSKRTYEWSETGEEVIMRNYDSAGILALDTKIGASMVYSKYVNGMLKEVVNLNSDSVETDCSEGYARVEFTHEADGENKWYYNSNNDLIKVLNRRTSYLMGLQLRSSSVPSWLRRAKRSNMVDGVRNSSFWYEFTLDNQNFDGEAKFSVELIRGGIATIGLNETLNVSEKWVRKISKALCGAYFISRSMLDLSPTDGVIIVKFEKATPE